VAFVGQRGCKRADGVSQSARFHIRVKLAGDMNNLHARNLEGDRPAGQSKAATITGIVPLYSARPRIVDDSM
jgi:hypothetical protein